MSVPAWQKNRTKLYSPLSMVLRQLMVLTSSLGGFSRASPERYANVAPKTAQCENLAIVGAGATRAAHGPRADYCAAAPVKRSAGPGIAAIICLNLACRLFRLCVSAMDIYLYVVAANVTLSSFLRLPCFRCVRRVFDAAVGARVQCRMAVLR